MDPLLKKDPDKDTRETGPWDDLYPYPKEELGCDSRLLRILNLFKSPDWCFPLPHLALNFWVLPSNSLILPHISTLHHLSINPSLCADSASCL